MKLQLAKKHHAKKIAKFFSEIRHKSPQKVQNLIEQKRIFVLKDKKKIKAAFSFTVITLFGYFSFMYIQKLAVDPTLQGQGVGTYLLARIKQLTTKAGITAFFLFSVHKAKKFYQRNKLRSLSLFFWWKNPQAR